MMTIKIFLWEFLNVFEYEFFQDFGETSHLRWNFLFQVIQATIEKHKQNSETFRAFNSSFSQDEDHVPDSSVSLSA